MTKKDIELPPLPAPYQSEYVSDYFTDYHMEDYARAAIEADRQQRGEPVGYIDKHEMQGLTECGLSARVCPHEGSETVPVYAAPQPAEVPFCEECGDGIMAHDPGICGTCYQTKYVAPQHADPEYKYCDDGKVVWVNAADAPVVKSAEPVRVPSDAQAQSITDRFRNGVAKVLGLGSEGNRFADTYLLGLISDLVELENEFTVRDERRIAMRETTRHLLYEHKDVFSSHPKKSDLRKHIKELDAENDQLHALLARTGMA